MPVDLMAAALRGVLAGASGAVLWLLMRGWMGRRVIAKREAASRKIMERLGR